MMATTTMTSITPAPLTLNAETQFELNRVGTGAPAPSGTEIDAAGFGAVATDGLGVDESFADYLALARETFNSNGADGTVNEIKNKEDVVRAGARELVATAFFAPLFKLMREDPLRAEVVPMSAGEKMFGPMLHAEFAKEITAKGNFPLVEAIARSLLPARAVEAADEATSPRGENQGGTTTADENVEITPPTAATWSRRSELKQSELKQQRETVDIHG